MILVMRAVNARYGSLLVAAGERRKMRTVHKIPTYSAGHALIFPWV